MVVVIIVDISGKFQYKMPLGMIQKVQPVLEHPVEWHPTWEGALITVVIWLACFFGLEWLRD